MKHFFLILFMIGFYAIAGLVLLHKSRVEMVWTDANATPQVGVVATSGSCSDTPVTVFNPTLAYTLTVSGDSAAGPTTASSAMVLTGAVNGDTAPTVTTLLGQVSGHVVFASTTPTLKIGGLVCSTQDRASWEIHGDGSDSANIDIAYQTTGSTSWDASKKVDAAISTSKIMIFGASGQVGTSAIIDGSDFDAVTNGEVAFGGTNASAGGSKTFVKLNIIGRTVDPAVDKETLTATLTPQ